MICLISKTKNKLSLKMIENYEVEEFSTIYSNNRMAINLLEIPVTTIQSPPEDTTEYHFPDIRDTEIPSERPIKFTLKGKERKNVNKCICRFVFKNYSKEEMKAIYTERGVCLDQDLIKVIEHIKSVERNRSSKDGRKDYKKLIKMMLCYKRFRRIIGCCLEYLDHLLEKRKYRSIKENNKMAYVKTIKDYKDYIEGIEAEVTNNQPNP